MSNKSSVTNWKHWRLNELYVNSNISRVTCQEWHVSDVKIYMSKVTHGLWYIWEWQAKIDRLRVTSQAWQVKNDKYRVTYRKLSVKSKMSRVTK